MTGIPAAAGAVATAVPGAIANAIPDAIGAILPRNCSIGTRQVCVGLANNISCPNQPLGITSLLIGTLLLSIFTGFSIAFALDRPHFLVGNVISRIILHPASGLLCCIPFGAPIMTVWALASAAENLPPWIYWQLGEAYRLCIGALCCAGCIVVLGSVVQFMA